MAPGVPPECEVMDDCGGLMKGCWGRFHFHNHGKVLVIHMKASEKMCQ